MLAVYYHQWYIKGAAKGSNKLKVRIMIITVLRSRTKGDLVHQAISVHGLGESKFVDQLYQVYENGKTYLISGGQWSSEPALVEAFDNYESDFESSIHIEKQA